MMEDGYVDIEALVTSYEYAEEAPELFEEEFFNSVKDDDNETN